MNEGKFDFGFAWNGCARICRFVWPKRGAMGRASRSPLWSTAFYSEVEKMGGKRWDTSSLLARLQR